MMTAYDIECYNPVSFPQKLHRLLEDSEYLSFGQIVSWQPGGTSFKVNDPERFENLILKQYFNQTKYKSFQRQLNIYGFKRVQTGPNKGGYIHSLFVKNSPELCEMMERRRPNNHVVASGENSKIMSLVQPIRVSVTEESVPQVNSKELDLNDYEVKTFYDFFFPKDPLEKDSVSAEAFFDHMDFPNLEDNVEQDRMLDIAMSDIDFKHILPLLKEDSELQDQNDLASDTDSKLLMSSDEQNSFPWKVHLMLENSKKDKYQQIVSWVGDGTAFKVHNRKAFVETIMPNYFDQTKYESFRRQLNLYGFARISQGADKGVISHPYLREGERWLCGNITKKATQNFV